MNIFGDPRSTNTRKVLTTLLELSTPHELVHVDFGQGEHKGAAHLARQPFGQMPALNDDGFELYETQAICRYLNEKASGALIPSALQERAVMNQWMSIETANFSEHAMKFVYHYLLHVTQEPSALEQATVGLRATLGVLGAQLSRQPFVAGKAFTLADICFMPYFEYALLTPAKELFSEHPSLLTWWNTVRERSSWARVVGRA